MFKKNIHAKIAEVEKRREAQREFWFVRLVVAPVASGSPQELEDPEDTQEWDSCLMIQMPFSIHPILSELFISSLWGHRRCIVLKLVDSFFC